MEFKKGGKLGQGVGTLKSGGLKPPNKLWDINIVFLKVNDDLQKINECYISNKLSLNVKKNK